MLKIINNKYFQEWNYKTRRKINIIKVVESRIQSLTNICKNPNTKKFYKEKLLLYRILQCTTFNNNNEKIRDALSRKAPMCHEGLQVLL